MNIKRIKWSFKRLDEPKKRGMVIAPDTTVFQNEGEINFVRNNE